MKTFQDLLLEKTDSFKIIYNAYNLFLCKELGINKKVKMSIVKKVSAKTFGYVDLNNKLDYKVKVESGSLTYTLGNLAHEFTHIKQIQNKELTSDDGTTIKWKGKDVITGEEYNKLSYDEYAKLPWEEEAIANQTKFTDKFLETDFLDLEGTNDELDFIIRIQSR